MKTIKSENELCLICMEEHEVQTVSLEDIEEYKGEKVSFNATYKFCADADEFLETEEMIKTNSLAMKDAHREKVGLLNSQEIIRDKYEVSQKDFLEIWDFDRLGYRFHPVEEIKELTPEEIEILDAVIAEVGHLNSREIIDKMHDRDAYKCTR